MERSETGYRQLHKVCRGVMRTVSRARRRVMRTVSWARRTVSRARRTALLAVGKGLGRAVPAAFFLLLWAFCVPGLSVRAAEAAAPVHDPKFADCRVEYGIDVSYHQGEIDWERARDDGVRFAFIRVARRGSLDGSLAVDVRAYENIEGASAAGIPIGVYIYSQAVSTEEAVEEADYILAAIEPYRDKITLPVVMDYEFSDLSGNRGRLERAGLSQSQGTEVCLAFCRRVEEMGYTPMVYANETMLARHLYAEEISSRYPIWLANHTFETSYQGEYDFWQYTSRGIVDGIGEHVDLNVHYIRPQEDGSVPGGGSMQEGGSTSQEDGSVPGGGSMQEGSPLTVDESPGEDFQEAPVLTAVIQSPDAITLSWTEIAGASGYELERFDWKEGAYVVIAKLQGAEACAYQDAELSPGVNYIYRVRAYVSGAAFDAYGPILR